MKKAKISLKSLKNKAKNELEKVKDLKELDEVQKRYLGKQSELVLVLRSLEKMPKARRVKVGSQANELKRILEEKIKEKKSSFAKVAQDKKDWLDISVPGKRPVLGHLHPLTQTKREVEEIFQSMGFSVAEGPEVETEWYNFDALNIPKDHPARDLWDTFWLKTGGQKLLLRTHTSPVQARYMEKHNPPLRIIALGNCFRREATDVSHEFQICQVEGLMVDKNISAANFKAIIEEFLSRFFSKEIKIRLRPDFFPFTEPSFDISVTCVLCNGKGCQVCKQTGWLEMGGAGMVHPNVFKNVGYNPRNWQGWAFGFGIDRLAMMKYKINEIRLFRGGDLRFLQQF